MKQLLYTTLLGSEENAEHVVTLLKTFTKLVNKGNRQLSAQEKMGKAISEALIVCVLMFQR